MRIDFFHMLIKLFQWCSKTSKSKHLVFWNEKICELDECVSLCVKLDSKLKFHSHIKQSIEKTSKSIDFLFRLSSIVPLNMLQIIIIPLSALLQYNLELCIFIQNRVIRINTCKSYLDQTNLTEIIVFNISIEFKTF